MVNTEQLTTFEIKMTILTIMASNAEKEKAEELYKWVMEELLVEENKSAEVTSLKTVQ